MVSLFERGIRWLVSKWQLHVYEMLIHDDNEEFQPTECDPREG